MRDKHWLAASLTAQVFVGEIVANRAVIGRAFSLAVSLAVSREGAPEQLA